MSLPRGLELARCDHTWPASWWSRRIPGLQAACTPSARPQWPSATVQGSWPASGTLPFGAPIEKWGMAFPARSHLGHQE